VDGGGWIRPVSEREHGELEYRHYRLPDGSEPGVLDVIRVGLSNPQPLPHQPENWRVDGSGWNLIERPASSEYGRVIAAAVCHDPVLFGNMGKSVSEAHCHEYPGRESLVLIPPSDIRWLHRSKARVEFRLESLYYDLPLTDPAYVGALKRLEEGDHPSSALGIPEDRKILFTISLGEPLEGICYKLVAAVVVMPRKFRKSFIPPGINNLPRNLASPSQFPLPSPQFSVR
jgi:hypothetical protein